MPETPKSEAPDDGGPVSFGLTVRDYFAAKAMEGTIANPSEGQMEKSAREKSVLCAAWAYEMADAMLAERKKTP